MGRNFDMDAAIRRALRESIEAHAHEWEPKFKTGVGPVGDDAPFDKKVSGDVNEGKDCEDCCPKCGKCPCECDKVNEGTIPGDSHEWEPDFKTGVGPVGDDNPFTQAVNESFLDTNDWEAGSFGASNHRKEGISFADGGDECQNGVVATGQKNSGEVVSSDNLSESEDEDEDEGIGGALAGGAKYVGNKIKNAFSGLRNAMQRGSQAQDIRRDRRDRDAGQAKVDAYNQKYGVTEPKGPQGAGAQPQAEPQPAATSQPAAGAQGGQQSQQGAGAQGGQQGQAGNEKAEDAKAAQATRLTFQSFKEILTQMGFKLPDRESTRFAWKYIVNEIKPGTFLNEDFQRHDVDVISEERDRFFNIINRIEKLYD